MIDCSIVHRDREDGYAVPMFVFKELVLNSQGIGGLHFGE